MPVDLIKKNSENHYDLTNEGEMTAYFYTIQKLLNHYMIKYKSMSQDSVQQKLSDLKNFMNQNFKSLDDYLNKINLLADFIHESDVNTFSGFIGKQFLPVLNNTKKSLLDREVPKYKDRYENPLRTPSYALLEDLEDIFLKSPALVWPPVSVPPSTGQVENVSNASNNGSIPSSTPVSSGSDQEGAGEINKGGKPRNRS